MRQKLRKGLTVVLAAAMLMVGLSGCKILENTEIVLTTGLSGDQLFKVGKSVCTLPEAMIYVMDYQDQYEGTYGVEMWEHDFGGVTLEEYVKDTIISQLASMKAVTLLAEEYEVKLSDTEKENVKEAAKSYMNALTGEAIAYMGVEKEDVEHLYETHVLSRKVYAEITKDVNTEVSDDEARIITVQQIRLDTLEDAQDILNKLGEGKEFMTLASVYSKDSQITYTFGRGEGSADYESVAFDLENEEVSEIVELEDGYYILKCVNNFDREATENNKITLVEKRRDEIFGQVYEALIANTPSEFNTKLWKDVHFENWNGEITADFLEIYKTYFAE